MGVCIMFCCVLFSSPVLSSLISSPVQLVSPKVWKVLKSFALLRPHMLQKTVVTTSSRLLPMYPPPVLSVPGVVTTSLKLFNQFPGTLHIHLMLDTIQRPPVKSEVD